jgi:exonuclease SbcD
MGEAYAATGQALPTALDYVALGHIHAPQPVPGVAVPAEYAGSLLQLDFGEAGEAKRVVLVEAEPGVPAVIESIPVRAGRSLVRVSGSWDDLAGRDDLDGAWLDLVVDTDGPDPGLVDVARERFEGVVKVQARYHRPAEDVVPATSSGRPWSELYGEYHEHTYGKAAPAALLEAFIEAEEHARGAAR